MTENVTRDRWGHKALEGELTEHLGYEKHSTAGRKTGNSRNGKTSKRVIDGEGAMEIEVPRDRNGDFEPQLIKKRQTRLPGFDDKVIYTTNAIESLNAQLRKVTRKRGSFPSEDSVKKVIYLAMTRVAKRWNRPIRDWPAALNYFSIAFEGRLPA